MYIKITVNICLFASVPVSYTHLDVYKRQVVGSVVSTRKNEKLIGNKFMIVEPVHHMKGDLSQIVAIDIIGAGIGEYVLAVSYTHLDGAGCAVSAGNGMCVYIRKIHKIIS